MDQLITASYESYRETLLHKERKVVYEQDLILVQFQHYYHFEGLREAKQGKLRFPLAVRNVIDRVVTHCNYKVLSPEEKH